MNVVRWLRRQIFGVSFKEMNEKINRIDGNYRENYFIKELLLEMNKDNLGAIFNTIYKTNYWGCGSGSGSNENLCKGYVAYLQEFFKQNGVKSIVDCGCGDWQFSKNIDFGEISYQGFDVAQFVIDNNQAKYAKENISFHLYDGDFDKLPSADLLICKDVLQHLPIAKIKQFIDNLHKFKFALITNDIGKVVNRDIEPGNYTELDLRQEPFNLDLEIVYEFLRMPRAPDMLTMLWQNPNV